MFPLSDAPNPPRTPFVTYLLIAANVLVFLAFTVPLSVQAPSPTDPRVAEYVAALRESLPANVPLRDALASLTVYDLFVFEHGYKPGAPEWADLFAAMFLHGGFMHLFGNMLFLWIYGDNVEYRLGRMAYLAAYLLTGVAATLAFGLLAPSSLIPMVGASGAISGILGFYFLWFPRNVVRVLLLFFPFLVRVVEVPARIVLGLYLFVDNILPMLVAGGDGGSGVAHGAHIGGFVAGLAIAWLLARRAVQATPDEYRGEAPASARAPADAVSRAMEEGDMATAARAYFALPSRAAAGALEPHQTLALGRWLLEHRHGQAAASVFQRHIQAHPRGPGLAEAHVGAGVALLDMLDQPASAYQHFMAALHEATNTEVAAEARAGLARIGARQKLPARRFAG